MTKADKMFEELGYTKEKIDDDVCFSKFWEETKSIEEIYFFEIEKRVDIGYDEDLSVSFNAMTVSAIREKLKELGWIND